MAGGSCTDWSNLRYIGRIYDFRRYLDKIKNKVFMISQNETGNYTRLSFEILFERAASWTVMTVMVPYTMLLIIAWFTYWLHPKV